MFMCTITNDNSHPGITSELPQEAIFLIPSSDLEPLVIGWFFFPQGPSLPLIGCISFPWDPIYSHVAFQGNARQRVYAKQMAKAHFHGKLISLHFQEVFPVCITVVQ